jgi:Tfp pilus assembly protein FimT
MKNTKRIWHLTMVDVLVGLAVLMILSALVVPVFLPPQGRAASRAAAPDTSVKSTQH